MANTVVSLEPTMQEEVIQDKEETDNVDELMANKTARQEPTVKTKADLEKNNVRKLVDN